MRLLKRAMLAIALAFAVTLTIPTASAQAHHGWHELCFYVVEETPDGPVLVEECLDRIYLSREIFPPCIVIDCNPILKIKWWDRDPVWQHQFIERFGPSYRLLVESHLAEDPQDAQQLREQSIKGFLHAAELQKDYELSFEEVAWFEPKTGKVYEAEDPRLWDAGKNMITGQNLMVLALQKPEALDAAMEYMDASVADLVGK